MAYGDEFLVSITIWREDRGGFDAGMRAVANVIANRVKQNHSSFYGECIKRLQFSSITAPGDSQLTLWPADIDAQWKDAQAIAAEAVAGTLEDTTGGATLYFAPASIRTTATFTLPDGTVIPFPQGWNAAVVVYTVTIGGQVFFKQL